MLYQQGLPKFQPTNVQGARWPPALAHAVAVPAGSSVHRPGSPFKPTASPWMASTRKPTSSIGPTSPVNDCSPASTGVPSFTGDFRPMDAHGFRVDDAEAVYISQYRLAVIITRKMSLERSHSYSFLGTLHSPFLWYHEVGTNNDRSPEGSAGRSGGESGEKRQKGLSLIHI